MERGQKSKKEKVSVAATFILASEKACQKTLGPQPLKLPSAAVVVVVCIVS